MKTVVRVRLCFALVIWAVCIGKLCFAEGITVMLDSEPVSFDVEPIICEERVLVPMRKIFNELGAEVEWLAETKTIIATRGSEIIAMQVGSDVLICKDIKDDTTDIFQLDLPPQIIDGRTLVPLRAVSEALHCEVFWNDEAKTVYIKQ